VGDHHEVDRLAELAQRFGEPADVRLVECGIDLVEDAERDRVHAQHGE